MPGIVNEKENLRDERSGDIADLKKEMAEDENASSIAIATILRETVSQREVKDETEAALRETEEKIEFLQKEKGKAEEEVEEAQKEGMGLGQDRLAAETKLAEIKTDLVPLQRNSDELAAQRKALEEELAGIRNGNETLQAQLNKLVAKREEILVDFREREKFYRETIKTPPWIYYGDKVSLKVTNVRPSGVGLFLPIGYGHGVKDGMEFLARRIDPTAPSRRSRRLRITLVQSNYCFAEEIPGFGEPDLFLRAEETLEIERSGETNLDKDGTGNKKMKHADETSSSGELPGVKTSGT